MPDECGKNCYYDFAGFANAGATGELAEPKLIHSENLYRASSLIAYGIGLASKRDISAFTEDRLIPTNERSDEGEEEVVEVRAVLPCAPSFPAAFGDGVLRVPHEYENILGRARFVIPSINVKPIASGSYLMFTMHVHSWLGLIGGSEHELRTMAYQRDRPQLIEKLDEYDTFRLLRLREPYKVLGQVIANAHVADAYAGTFSGKSKFRPFTQAEQLWLALVQLTDKQLPGLCPVCGKVVDRRASASGGHPKKTCCNAHSDKLSNLKRKIRKETDMDANVKSLTKSDELEEAVRLLRWRGIVPNERPLGFGGTELLPHTT